MTWAHGVAYGMRRYKNFLKKIKRAIFEKFDKKAFRTNSDRKWGLGDQMHKRQDEHGLRREARLRKRVRLEERRALEEKSAA